MVSPPPLRTMELRRLGTVLCYPAGSAPPGRHESSRGGADSPATQEASYLPGASHFSSVLAMHLNMYGIPKRSSDPMETPADGYFGMQRRYMYSTGTIYEGRPGVEHQPTKQLPPNEFPYCSPGVVFAVAAANVPCLTLPFLLCDGVIDQEIGCGHAWKCPGNGLHPITSNATCAAHLMVLDMIPAPGPVRNLGSKEWARGEKLQFQR
ncbi:hypothetical protein FB451DRAFT_1178573 [Mycena latifolia]|nr:hypothetical protein FB451DRAFT_1178573 [Mycena latifolia]